MKPSERRKARHCATQAIYQWQMTKANVGDIEEQFKIDQDTKGVDLSYFRDLLFGVALTATSWTRCLHLTSPVRWKKWTWWTRRSCVWRPMS